MWSGKRDPKRKNHRHMFVEPRVTHEVFKTNPELKEPRQMVAVLRLVGAISAKVETWILGQRCLGERGRYASIQKVGPLTARHVAARSALRGIPPVSLQ